VSNCCWSFAKRGLVHGDVVARLQEAVKRTSHEMDPQHVDNTLWAFAAMQMLTAPGCDSECLGLEECTGCGRNSLKAFATLKQLCDHYKGAGAAEEHKATSHNPCTHKQVPKCTTKGSNVTPCEP
jgi:hypothetical protein